MLGQFNLLPLLKGWAYKDYTVIKNAVVRGVDPVLGRNVNERGWLFSISILTTDAYGTLIIDFQGADLQMRTSRWWPQMFVDIGALPQDPSGWVPLYRRPNPNSTFGTYFCAVTPGYQGAVLPYVPTVKVSAYLPDDSTETSAYVAGSAAIIAITKPKDFIKSLRRLLDPDAKLKIDKALMAVGPAEFGIAKKMLEQATQEEES